MRQRTFTILRGFIFLAFFSSAISDDSFNDENSLSGMSLLKERCFENPDLIPCHFWNLLQEQVKHKDKIQPPNIFNTFESMENETLPDKQVTEENGKEEILIEIPFVNPERSIEKRFTVFRRRNPNAQGFKRGPGFRSWGGKRNSIYVVQDLDKKSKFTSWGGKRDSLYTNYGRETEEKRTKFVNWGGRQGDLKNVEEFAPKRSKFVSWGGKKRTVDPEENQKAVFEKKDPETSTSSDHIEKKGPYWNFKGLYLREPFKKHVPKRPQFQSWGGKRTLPFRKDRLGFYVLRYPRFQFTKFIDGGEKRKFSSWGGKRYKNEGLIDKRSDVIADAWKGKTFGDFKGRHITENWGQKSSFPEERDDIIDTEFINGIFDSEPQKNENEKSLEGEKKTQIFEIDAKNLPNEYRFESKTWGNRHGYENTTR